MALAGIGFRWVCLLDAESVTFCYMGKSRKRGGRYTAPISKQVAEAVRGVTGEMALAQIEAELSHAEALTALDDLALHMDFVRSLDARFLEKVSMARHEGRTWKEIGDVCEMTPRAVQMRYLRVTRAFELALGVQ